MRILHLIYDHPGNTWVGGGGGVRAWELCRRLAARGHDITILSGRYPGAEDYANGGLGCRFVGSGRNYPISTFSYALEAARFVRRHGRGFDIVVEDFAPWNPVFSRFLTRTPVVLHANHSEGFNILRRWKLAGAPFFLLDRFYPRLFRRVTALSEATRRRIKVRRAVVVPAGISAETLRDGLREGVEEDFILYMGRLEVNNKGLDTLLEALRLSPGIRLLMAGKGRDEAALRRMAEGLDVEFKGFVSEEQKAELMRRARLLVLPSRFEGWGIVVLEAAAFGRPVVVSDIPELEYAVRGGFGLSFRGGDPADLAARLKELLGDSALRQEMGRKARQFAGEYTWDRIAEDYGRFLEGIAGGKVRETSK